MFCLPLLRLSRSIRLIACLTAFMTVAALTHIAKSAAVGEADDASPQPAVATASLNHPFVAGFDRFYASQTKSADTAGGLLLLGELNCTACHSADGQAAIQIDAKQAPLLGEVAARANPKYLQRFILDPHGTKPGTTMPNLLSGIEPSEAQATAEAITHYLASIATSPWRAPPVPR